MARKSWSEEDEPCALQMGPMMDCVFLLILYFVSVSTIDTARISKDVQLPNAKSGIKEEDESGRFMVDIEWDEVQYQAIYKASGNIFTDARDLVPLMEKSAAQNKNNRKFRVVIRADKRVPYEYTQQVMTSVAQANVPNMMFSTLEEGSGPAGGG